MGCGFGLQRYGRTLAYNMTDSGFDAQDHKRNEEKIERKKERRMKGRKKLMKKGTKTYVHIIIL